MQRVQDFQNPAEQPIQETKFQDEWTPRYGILVGGVKEIAWNGVGEQSVGHHVITRRVWMSFVRLQVGRRNEFDGALDMPMNAIQVDWAKSSERIVSKSPRACAQDVLASHKDQGYCVPTVLIGHPDPQSLSERVWPRSIRDSKRLFEHIAYFESFQTDDEDEAKLAAELLEACYTSRNNIAEYVRMLKTELTSKNGLKNLNANLEELFREINEPLPEQKANLAAQEMGKEIVRAAGGNNSDKMYEAMMAQTAALQEQNRLQAERNEKSEEQNRLLLERLTLATGSNPEPKETSAKIQISKTSTKRVQTNKE